MAEQLTQQPTVVATEHENVVTQHNENAIETGTDTGIDSTATDLAAVQLANEIVTKIIDESIKNVPDTVKASETDAKHDVKHDVMHDVLIDSSGQSVEPDELSSADSDPSESSVPSAPSTPIKARSTLNRRCGCDCECWKRNDYPGLAPRKAGYKEGTDSTEYVVIMACKHFASCHLSGTTCESE